VLAPKADTHNKTEGEYSKRGEHFMINNTPAVTIVAAWIKAETGVGPSIALGSQVCSPIWADFPTAPKKSNAQIISNLDKVRPQTLIVWSFK